MSTNSNTDTLVMRNRKLKYKLVAPEGQWGYVITFTLALLFIVTVGPLCSFGIIYGNFLAQIGNEASSTALLICIFNTAVNFMGLIANWLFKSYSYRVVGICGSIAFFIGNFLTTFATSVTQMILTFGLLQGAGFGLMLTAGFTSFNQYFIVRKNVMMSISQTIIAAVSMLLPLFARFLMDTYGYRGTVAIFSALSLHAFLAMVTLQPIQKHLRKVYLSEDGLENIDDSKENQVETMENNSLLVNITTVDGAKIELSNCKVSEINGNNTGRRINSTGEWKSLRKSISTFFELSLLKDPIYMNISIGLALAFTSDIMFVSILPMFLRQLNFIESDVAFIMTLYMCADLVGRTLLSLVSGLASFKNRNLFFFGTLLTALLRIGVTLGEWRYWIISILVLLSILRAFIQVLPPLVLAEYTRHTFSASFAMYMTMSAITGLVLAPLSSVVGSLSGSAVSVIHLLTVLLLLCGVPWSLELTITYFRKSKTKDLNERKITPQ